MGHSCTPQTTASPVESDQSTAMQRVRQFRCFGVATVEAIAFWSAVALPVPMLLSLAGGVETHAELGFMTLLLTANLAALYLGHGYGSAQPQ